MGVSVEPFEIEVGIGRLEVENGVLLLAEPILETGIPTFDKHFVETMLRREIDVFFDVGRIRRMLLRVWHVCPVLRTGDHRPPYADVFDWMNPACVFDGARLVEVERYSRCEDVSALVADDQRPPRRYA